MLENGMVDFNSTFVTGVATFTCNIGYNLVGDSQRVCQPNGVWSNMVPMCVRKLLAVLFCDYSFCGFDHFSYGLWKS